MVILKKDGFYDCGQRKGPSGEWEDYEEKIDTAESWDLLTSWKEPLEIQKDVTCMDFFMLLADMDEALLTVIEMLCNSNIKPYLRKAFDPLPDGWKDDEESKLDRVEIYKNLEVDNGIDLNVFSTEGDWPSAHGVGMPWNDDGSPFSAEEKIKNGMNVWAIEFTPWNELAHLKLTIRPKMWFSYTVWKPGERRKLISNIDDGEEWNYFDKDIDKEKSFQHEINYTVSVGEFFDGFCNELCFFSSPADRDAKREDLKSRLDPDEDKKE